MRLRLKITLEIWQEMACLDLSTAVIAFKKLLLAKSWVWGFVNKGFSTTDVRKLECQQNGLVMSERMMRIFPF